MTTRKTAILVTVLVAALASISALLLLPDRHVGELEHYSGTGRGIDYAGVRREPGNAGAVLFRYFNGKSQAIAFRPRAMLRQGRKDGEWVQDRFKDAAVFRVPAHHALTFEFPAPEGDRPWRVTFEEAEIPHAARSLPDRFERLLGRRSSYPPFDGVRATPAMQGLAPEVEPSDPPNDGPATSIENSNGPGGGRHR